MTPRFVSLAFLALLALVSTTTGSHAESGPLKVERAVNMARWFTWPRYEPTGSGIAWPPYKEAPGEADFAALSRLRDAGFDTIRLPVDPAPLIVFEGERREEVYGVLFEAIRRIEAAGLNVIVDIHPNSRHPVWGQNAVIAGVESPAFVAVATVIEEMARRLQGHIATAALELLNEPRLKCKGPDRALWQDMVQHFHARAATANPELTLIVTGACISTAEGLMALDPGPFAGTNTLYTFHFYEPFSFTHQGAPFIPWPDKYLDGVPWPATARPISEPAALLDQRVKSVAGMSGMERVGMRGKAMQNLRRYYKAAADIRLIEQRFREVATWAGRHNIPTSAIFIGEFGVLRREPGKPGAFCTDRARWLSDVRKAAAIHGFSWAYFNYDGPFGLIEGDDKERLDPVILAALGFESPCASARFFEAPRSAGYAADADCAALCAGPESTGAAGR
jgi:endoglucanase